MSESKFLTRRPFTTEEAQLLGIEEEWAEWYLLSPAERWKRSSEMWTTFLMLGGTLDPEPDTQSPFHDPEAPSAISSHGRAGLRIIRRGGI